MSGTNGSLLRSILAGSNPQGQDSASASRRALAWGRVSTDMQEERGLSMPEQLREIREYATRSGIGIVAEYHEAASAFQREDKRIEFHRMVARAKEDPSIGVILVHDMSRFSRDSVRAKTLLRELRQAGVEVVSLSDPVADPETVAGVYMEAITLAKNEAYSREIAFHTRKGCRATIRTRDPETGWCYKNGGQPLWGYRTERLNRGTDKKGRPILKAVWVLDDTVVNSRPVYEWARHCLVEMAAQGASLDRLRDFCNEHSIPAPRRRHWGTSTWHSILEPHKLLQYAGYGVWNVHCRNGVKRSPTDWVVVEGAQEALITEDEAMAIARERQQRAATSPGGSHAQRRARRSGYLLSGGLFTCARCGANLVGHASTNGKGRSGRYYICGSAKYRKGLGCGDALYVDKRVIEEAVLHEVSQRADACLDWDRVTALANSAIGEESRRQGTSAGDVQRQMADIDREVENVRAAIEAGVDDVAWASARLSELKAQRARLQDDIGTPPVATLRQLTRKEAELYGRAALRCLSSDGVAEQRAVIRRFVDQTRIEPTTGEITISVRRLPAQMFQAVVAGACYAAMHNALRQWLVRRWALPAVGRRRPVSAA